MIETTVEDGIATVRFDDGKVNVIDLPTIRELAAAVEAQSESRAIVLEGAPRAFSAGVDLASLLEGDLAYTEEFLDVLETFVIALHRLPIPTVAAVTGHAIAGGCLLVQACDHRVMGQGRIGVTESLVGLPVPPAGLEVLRSRTGSATAGLVRTGRTVEPAEALALGLVDEVVAPEDVVARAHEAARAFADTPAATYALHKSLLHDEADRRIDQARGRYGEEARQVWVSAEPRAYAQAYLASLAKKAKKKK